jgi:tetratricopeptide (TPR) repeat protein
MAAAQSFRMASKKQLTMQKIFSLLIVSFLLFSCKQKQIVTENEITLLLQLNETKNSQLQLIETDIAFWNKRFEKTKDDLTARLKLGGLYNRRFQYTGNINDVHKSDSFYLTAHQLQKLFSSGTYRSLATNCITQHKFKEAALYLDSAYQLGDDKYITLLQQFDVAIELGNYLWASSILQQFKYKNTFEYYIRNAKLQDHLGNSKETISNMEKALAKAQESKNENILLWAQSNLADMYSHQNKITEAYALYKKVLETDPHYYHALKGIAWIAFSYDKNTVLAKEILQKLKSVHPVPDYDYLLAEIAASENNKTQKEIYTTSFLKAVSNPAYGDMYNKYVFSIQSDERNNYTNALRIAQTEVNNRPTPQSYDLLAWAYYKSGNMNEAIAIAEKQVVNKNFEPDAIYHLGILYKQTGNKKLARKYLKEAMESSFELGPLVTKEIKEELEQL